MKKWEKCNDTNLHKALLLMCMESQNSETDDMKILGGYYAFNKNKLTFGLNICDGKINNIPRQYIQVLCDNIPKEKKYMNFDVISVEEFLDTVDEDVANTTGRVSLYNPETDRI